MKLVIEIDRKFFNALPKEFYGENEVDKSLVNEILVAVIRSTPLPKGHGRLIDADALIKSTDKEDVHMYEIALAPTIIEADKEGAE